MAESTYHIIEVVGTSPKSWEEAAKNAVAAASKSLKDLRVAEVVELDLKIEKEKSKLKEHHKKQEPAGLGEE